MSLCVTGITGLQLFWNYQNYKSSVSTFKHDINAALNTAVDREIDQRHQKIITVFKKWLADTSFVQITCNTNNRDSATVFTLKDTHPYTKGEKGVSLSLNDFHQKLRKITPAARVIFTNYFSDVLLKQDLKKGIIYFYTQRLGDSLTKVYNRIPLNTAELGRFYKSELSAKNIDAPFKLNAAKTDDNSTFLTQKVNTALRRPYIKQMVYAGFESPDAYFLKEMKWLLITSLLLIGITIFCFAYTVKTLMSQHKLAELKNYFVNNMTHELKTPVSTINIAAEAIQDFNLSKTSADEYLSIIRYQANNLTVLIDQILKSVVMEQEPISLNLTVVNIDVLIKQLIQQYKPQVEMANASINYTGADIAFRAMVDESLLKNAIANLLDNALKYGGQNVVIHIDCHAETGNLVIRVADNGVGIPAEYQDKVFDRFFRVPSGDVHNIKGCGLGLNYAKSIVERHNGSLKLTSHGNRGTEFIISIPLIYHETSQGAIA